MLPYSSVAAIATLVVGFIVILPLSSSTRGVLVLGRGRVHCPEQARSLAQMQLDSLRHTAEEGKTERDW